MKGTIRPSRPVARNAGPKHGNADGLSRRLCGQCQKIERDGGPTWSELTTETEGQLLAGEEDDSTSTSEARPIQEVAPDPSQLAKEQSEGYRAVATIHKAIQTGQDLLPKQIEAGSQELRKIYQRQTSMRLTKQGVLEIQVAVNEKPRWFAICPKQNRETSIWQIHQMSHSGVGKTINRLQLTLYWVGLHANLRRIVRSCEICQKAKSEGEVRRTASSGRTDPDVCWTTLAEGGGGSGRAHA